MYTPSRKARWALTASGIVAALPFTEIARRASARLEQILNDNPLLHPLGRASDRSIDEALTAHGLGRADLFTPETTFAPHRHRIAAMLVIHGLSPRDIARDHWAELKDADHRCAYCVNTKRCGRWLRWGRQNDAPRMFCPNAATFEQIKVSTTKYMPAKTQAIPLGMSRSR